MGQLSLEKRIDLAVLVAVALFITWYLYDAYKALASTENLILIAPVALLTLGLCCAEFVQSLKDRSNEKEQSESIRDVLPVMVIFTGYILSLEYLGFDVGTILFVGIFLRLHGEMRWQWIVVYSLLFGILVPLFFSQMLPYPMPMSFLPTDY